MTSTKNNSHKDAITTPPVVQCCCHNDGDPFVLRKEGSESESILLASDHAELILRSKVMRVRVQVPPSEMPFSKPGSIMVAVQEQIYYCPRKDAFFLKCAGAAPATMETILGIREDNQCPQVEVVCYRAEACNEERPRTRRGLHSDWKRASFEASGVGGCGQYGEEARKDKTQIQWVDLRHLQAERSTTSHVPFLSTQSGVVHFLRSILIPSHDVSPWAPAEETVSSADIVVLVLNCSSNKSDGMSFSLLKDFRVSDIAPSWYLHGYSYFHGLEESSLDLFSATKGQKISTNSGNAAVLIYKKLSHRPSLHITCPAPSCPDQDIDAVAQETSAVVATGCLWQEEEDKNAVDDNHHNPEKKVDDGESIGHSEETNAKSSLYRLVSPPYLNLDEEYPGANLIAKLFSKEALKVFTEDALSVPHWTPWPETAHYKTLRVSSIGNENDKPWTVFPLCYCFPSNDPEMLTWVPSTKAFVPRTCRLLEEILNYGDGKSYLRTALFSQLAPGSVLEEHTGWDDLANHVLRLHIPLVVPNGNNPYGANDDLCGTWVDGCVETHAVGRPLLFDDSKYHRAFNYSDSLRIVLIVDLARPERLPLGTSKMGHTTELDDFIQQMSTPK